MAENVSLLRQTERTGYVGYAMCRLSNTSGTVQIPIASADVNSTCICETHCAEGSINAECPVCGAEDADLTLCVGELPHAVTQPKTDSAESASEAVCICETRCSADTVNTACGVCSADVSGCVGAEAGAVSGWAIVSLVLAAVCAVLAVLLWCKSCKSRRLRKSAKAGRSPNGKSVKAADAAGTNAQLSVEVGKLHDQGARADQQDSFSVSDLQGINKYGLLAVVADGMGGLQNGGRVSQCAASAMMEGFYSMEGSAQSVLLALVERAVAAVNAELGESGLKRSGSTLVTAILKDKSLYFASVGDSRISLYRDGALLQLNRDHILRRELEVQAINRQTSWENAASHPKSQGLTSYLGMGALKYVDIPSRPVTLLPGDRVILMSDGVYNALSDQELCAELSKPAQQAADAIHARVAAKKYGNQDNYTAIILAVQ